MDEAEARAVVAEYFSGYKEIVFDQVEGVSVTGNISLRTSAVVRKLPVRFKYVSGNFDCSWNALESLENAPQCVSGSFICPGNRLKDFTSAPRVIGGSFLGHLNPLTSLGKLPFYVYDFIKINFEENIPLLSLLGIKGCKGVLFNGGQEVKNISDIINKYLGQGRPGMLPCANEMIKAGYGSNARLK